MDREKLGKIVLSDGQAMKKLEAIVHPLGSGQKEQEFLVQATTSGADFVVLDIPLLCSKLAVSNALTASLLLPRRQMNNVVEFWPVQGMTEEKFESILSQANS